MTPTTNETLRAKLNIKGRLYRMIMRIAHKFNWHYAPELRLFGGDTQKWCEWCGFRQTYRKYIEKDFKGPIPTSLKENITCKVCGMGLEAVVKKVFCFKGEPHSFPVSTFYMTAEETDYQAKMAEEHETRFHL